MDAPESSMHRTTLAAALTAAVAVALTLASTAPATAQQTAGSSAEPDYPLPLPETDSLLEVRDHPDAGRMELVLGPVDLSANLPHLRIPIQTTRWPADGWLHGFSWQLRTAEGEALPDAMLHHLNVLEPGSRQLFSTTARRVVAAGRETPEQSLPTLLGYPFQQGDRILVVGMFANPTDRPREDVYLHIDLEYTPEEGSLLPRMTVYPFYIDVLGPLGEKSFEVPPGRTMKSWEGSPAVDARILGVGGHAHDFATELSLVDLTTGDTVWRAEPVTREDGHRVVRVPTSKLWWTGGKTIRADHRYRATVVYENPTDEPGAHGGMGVIAGVVAADQEDWPPFDPRDPLYVADLWNTLTVVQRAHAHRGEMGHHGSPPGTIRDTTALDTLDLRRRMSEVMHGHEETGER